MAMLALSSLVHTIKPANSINWKMIREEEGDLRELYIPIAPKADKATYNKLSMLEKADAANYKVLDNSGVSAATGIDLGQQNLSRLLSRVGDPQIKASLKEKLQPFMGVSKENAVRAMRDAETRAIRNLQQNAPDLMSGYGIRYGDSVESAGPQPQKVLNKVTNELTAPVLAPGRINRSAMTLTDAEAEALTRAVRQVLTDDLTGAFNARSKEHKLQFALLPWQAQTAMMSLHYHTGSRPGTTRKKHVAFWKAATRGDLNTAIKCFEEEIVKSAPTTYIKRRKKELELLKQAAELWKYEPEEEKAADTRTKGVSSGAGAAKAAATPKPAAGATTSRPAPSLNHR